MNSKELYQIILKIRNKYLDSGFEILGLFGSGAHADNLDYVNDIDILYSCHEVLYKTYPGLKFFGILEKIKAELERETGKKIDLANREALNPVGKQYILPELNYVA